MATKEVRLKLDRYHSDYMLRGYEMLCASRLSEYFNLERLCKPGESKRYPKDIIVTVTTEKPRGRDFLKVTRRHFPWPTVVFLDSDSSAPHLADATSIYFEAAEWLHKYFRNAETIYMFVEREF